MIRIFETLQLCIWENATWNFLSLHFLEFIPAPKEIACFHAEELYE